MTSRGCVATLTCCASALTQTEESRLGGMGDCELERTVSSIRTSTRYLSNERSGARVRHLHSCVPLTDPFLRFYHDLAMFFSVI
jgi:hypothetical protein